MDSNPIDANSQEITDVLRLLKRRQQVTGRPYGPIAGVLCAVATFVWGAILREARINPHVIPSRAYLAWLAFAIVLGFSAAVAAILWCSVVNTRRLAADGDRIDEYNSDRLTKNLAQQIIATATEKQLAKCVADEVTRQLDTRDRAAKQQRWETLLSDTGTTGPSAPPPQPQQQRGGDPVVPFARRPGSARNSG